MCRSLPRPRQRTRRILTPRRPSRYEESRPRSHFGRRTEVHRSASSPFATVPPDKCRMHIKSGASVSARDTPDDMRSCGARGSYALRDEERTARSSARLGRAHGSLPTHDRNAATQRGRADRSLHALLLRVAAYAPLLRSTSRHAQGTQVSWRVTLLPFGPVTVNARPPRKSMVTLALVAAFVRSTTISPLCGQPRLPMPQRL
jgi:hypothetical protein